MSAEGALPPEEPEVGPIELRTLPRMRVARAFWAGAPTDLGRALAQVEEAARSAGVGPCGVSMAVYPRQVQARLDGTRLDVPQVVAELRTPVSDLAAPVAGELPIDFVRVDRLRAACRMYSGPPGDALRQALGELFAWMDRSKLARRGTCHHQAFLPNVHPGQVTVELRVPVAEPAPVV